MYRNKIDELIASVSDKLTELNNTGVGSKQLYLYLQDLETKLEDGLLI